MGIGRITLFSVVALSIGTCFVNGEKTDCSFENRQDAAGFQKCMDKIDEVFTDNKRFFFGTSFAEQCRYADLSNLECLLDPSLVARNYSIKTALFQSQDIALSNTLEAFINVTYNDPGGYYVGCDTMVSVNSSTFSLDPASDDTHEPFTLRTEPSFRLQMKPGMSMDPNQRYTIIIQDPGFYYFHMVHTNVFFSVTDGQAQDFSDVVIPYFGSGNAFHDVLPYAVMVFKQSSGILTVSEDWVERLAPGMAATPSTLQDFIAAASLTGPVAVNYKLASYDIYAVQRVSAVENCASFVEDALRTHPRPWLTQILPTNTSLDIFLSTKVSSPEFEVCCRELYYPKVNFTLNPIGNTLFSTALTRTGVGLEFAVNKTGLYLFPNKTAEFRGKYYTMLAVDPDIPAEAAAVGTNERPLVHMLATNGYVNNKGMLEFKNTLIGWNGPTPPDVPPQPHYYYFLLFEHRSSGEVNMTIDKLIQQDITVDCAIRGRCLFDIPRLTTAYYMKLVGASWFRAQRDEYVTYRRDKPSVCTRDEDNCDGPVGASVTLMASAVLILALMSLHIVHAL